MQLTAFMTISLNKYQHHHHIPKKQQKAVEYIVTHFCGNYTIENSLFQKIPYQEQPLWMEFCNHTLGGNSLVPFKRLVWKMCGYDCLKHCIQVDLEM